MNKQTARILSWVFMALGGLSASAAAAHVSLFLALCGVIFGYSAGALCILGNIKDE
jgi:hypothetical protein